MRTILTTSILCISVVSMFAQTMVWDKNRPFTSTNIVSATSDTIQVIAINDVILLKDTVVVPSNITLKFSEKGRLRIANESSSLVVNGTIDAGVQHIFDVSAKGVTSVRYESVSNIRLKQTALFYPEWWGIFPNIIPGKNGDKGHHARHYTHLKEMMLDVASSGGGTIKFSEGTYYIRDIVIDSNDITVLGEGKKTLLKFDRENFGFSTRRGGMFTIQGTTLEKYYSTVFPEGAHIAGNFLYDKEQYPIHNITVKDLAIEWNEDATREDPSMNGLTIVNATNVEIDNVHVNLFGANRAFYIGSIFDGDVTENIKITNSSGTQSRTGVFILHGYDSKEYVRKRISLGNILIENNVFDVVGIPELDIKNKHIIVKYLDKFSTGFYFIGNEFTKSFMLGDTFIERNLGPVVIKNNIINNAGIGLRSWLPGKDERKDYVQKVTVEGNTFNNFRYVGIFMPFANAIVKNNTFNIDALARLPLEFKNSNEEGFIATAIHIAKAPWKDFKSRQGPTNVLVEGNVISGCFLESVPIVVQPNEEGKVELRNNTIILDSSCTNPKNDIVITTNRRKFRTKRATIVLGNNIEDSSNQTPRKASVLLDVRRKKHLTVIENDQK